MKLVNDEYVIEINDILNNSEIDEVDLSETFGDKYKLHLARISSRTYHDMYSAFIGPSHRLEKQTKALRYIIKNDENKQNGLMMAMIENLREALITGGDLKEYENGVRIVLDVVKSRLESVGLWRVAEISYREEDIE